MYPNVKVASSELEWYSRMPWLNRAPTKMQVMRIGARKRLSALKNRFFFGAAGAAGNGSRTGLTFAVIAVPLPLGPRCDVVSRPRHRRGVVGRPRHNSSTTGLTFAVIAVPLIYEAHQPAEQSRSASAPKAIRRLLFRPWGPYPIRNG